MNVGMFSDAYVQPAECVIRIAGQEISDLYSYITEVKVEATRERYAEATITFFSPVDEAGNWLIADDARLATWAAITIEADFRTGTEEVLRGVILQVMPSFPANAGKATVTVTCRDDSARLDRGLKRKAWGKKPVGTTDAVILQTLAGDARLSVDPDSAAGQSNLVLLQSASDIVFLKERADANGYELIVQGGKIYFGPMRVALESQPTIMVYAGRLTNCRHFTPRNDGHQRRKVAYARRDDDGNPGSPVTIESNLPLMGTMPAQGSGTGLADDVDYLDRRTVPDDAQSEAMAQGRANRADMSVHADGELDGSLYGHVLRVGEPVEVDGVGELYSGTYYVDEVTHRFNGKGYDQAFKLMRNALGRKAGGGLAGALSALM